MRILLLNYEWPPLGGGAGVAARRLALRLVENGAEVDVVTSRSGIAGSNGTREPLPPGLEVYRVRTRRKGIHQAGVAGTAGYLAAALPVARRILRERRHDIVHVFFSLPTGAMLPFLPLGQAAVVVSLRGSDVPGYDRTKVRLQQAHRVLGPATRWIWRRADAVVAVCDSLARLAAGFGPGFEVDVIRNGVDLELFRPGDRVGATAGEPLRCLAVARLVRRKNVHDLLQAWTRLERGAYRLCVVGAGEQEARLHGLARTLGIEADVEFTGALDREETAARYREADIFVLCPADEAFGNVFAEALASGLPIVGSGIGGIPELVTDGENGLLVPPADPDAIAAAVRRLRDDPELRARMALANRGRAEAMLSWDQMAMDYAHLYETLLGTPGRISAEARPVVVSTWPNRHVARKQD